eukprot:scaffold129274_cov30-Tisochrysis_lutea.AAC.1
MLSPTDLPPKQGLPMGCGSSAATSMEATPTYYLCTSRGQARHTTNNSRGLFLFGFQITTCCITTTTLVPHRFVICVLDA